MNEDHPGQLYARDDASRGRTGRSEARRLIVVALLAAVVGGFVGARIPGPAASPSIVEGWANTNVDGTALAVFASPEDEWSAHGFSIGRPLWRTEGGPWVDGDGPTCVGTDPSVTVPVRVGVVPVRARYGPGTNVVAWVECLEHP